MSFFAFILIVLSAAMHASWNAIAKKNSVSWMQYTIICGVSACLWIHVPFWTPVELSGMPWKFWALMFCAVVSDLGFYCFGLILAYRRLEMSVAYPMMRALPILFTALISSCLGWGEPLTAAAVCGMIIAFCGCLMMSLKKFSDFRLKNYLNRNMLYVIMVALGITGYTVFDSQAQSVLRANEAGISGPVLSMTYYSAREMSLTAALFTVLLLTGKIREIRSFGKGKYGAFIAAGLLASLTYVTILTAMNYVFNVSYVQVFRQSGLIFALIISAVFLKERCTVPKITGVALIITGLTVTVICPQKKPDGEPRDMRSAQVSQRISADAVLPEK